MKGESESSRPVRSRGPAFSMNLALTRAGRSPAPRFHVATREAWFELRDAYSRFLDAFRTAAAKLKAGDRASPFPTGSFPPALPFVAA
jgi:hypothetical protein